MKLHILGTGNGGALNCYNTCFAIENNGEYLLVDGGGGNQILKQLELAQIDINQIHNVFLSHNHTDHIIGIIWVLRIICQKMKFDNTYEGNLNIYGSDESVKVLQLLIELLFPMIHQHKDRFIYNIVEDNQVVNINDMNVKFFDIQATKDKQFAFIINNQLAFCGDEPLKENLFSLVNNCKWLIHESFCLDDDENHYKAHQKGHCTVKEASVTAQKVNAENLIIVHTVDSDLENRQTLFTNESKNYFNGNVFVPNDLDVIDIL